MTEFAPVPDFALGPDIPESGYVVQDLGGGAHFVTQGMINTMFVETKNGVVLVDASPFLGTNCWRRSSRSPPSRSPT